MGRFKNTFRAPEEHCRVVANDFNQGMKMTISKLYFHANEEQAREAGRKGRAASPWGKEPCIGSPRALKINEEYQASARRRARETLIRCIALRQARSTGTASGTMDTHVSSDETSGE